MSGLSRHAVDIPPKQQAIRDKCFHSTGTFIEFKKEETEQSIPDRFEEQVRRYPGRLAVKTASQELTYDELNKAANRVARQILTRDDRGNEPVALLFTQGIAGITAILGVLKAGRAYVSLDPVLPTARLTYILRDSQAALIIASNQNLAFARELAQNHQALINIDELNSKPAVDNPGLGVAPDSPAYVMYTSGSTGQQKGIVQTHLNVLHAVMNHTNGFHICSDDRLTLLYSPAGISGVKDTLSALLNGASLHPWNINEQGLGGLALWLIGEGVTIYRSAASLFRGFVATLVGGENFSAIRLVYLGNEPVHTRDVDLFKQHFSPDCILADGLGSTETQTFRLHYIDHDTQISGSLVPPGYATEDFEVLLLDEHGNEVGVGQTGEIAVKSRYLSPGYWQRPDLTQAAFLPGPEGGNQRIYLTGDLGRMLPDGCLEHLGRKDFQVKVRGYRVEVAEIERPLLEMDEITGAYVMQREDQSGNPRLVAYLVADRHPVPTASRIRKFLKEKLPDHMLPSAYVLLDSLPTLPNGKVDRQVLPAPGTARPELEIPFAPPRTPVEESMVEIWQEILGLDQVGIHDNFLELGGDSLLASQVISQVIKTLKIELPLRSLFDAPTIADMAVAIKGATNSGTERRMPAISRVARNVPAGNSGVPRSLRLTSCENHLMVKEAFVFPTSFAQQRLWFLDQLEPGSAVYNVPLAIRLSGLLDVSALEQSLNEIVRRHETLRTTFSTVDGQPVQVISPPSTFTISVVDLQDLPKAEREAGAQELADEEAQRPFDLAQGPIFRTTLLRLEEEEHIFLLTMHHIASDGWSRAVLFRELAVLYEAFSTGKPSPLPELPVQYADFAQWQRGWLQGEVLEEQLSYWRQQLGGSLPALQLPTDYPRPAVQSHRGARQSLVLSKDLSDSVKALSRQEGATLFMTLLAAFQVLLHRYSGQEDIVVGSPIAGRRRVETEGLIGFFVNTLVLRTDLSGNPTFRELLGRVREVTLGAYDHQDMPFEKLVEELQPERDLSRNPLFDVMLNMGNLPPNTLELPGLSLDFQALAEPESKFSMTLYVVERGHELNLNLVCQRALFSDERITCCLNQFRYLLEQIVAAPHKPIQSYSLVNPESLSLLPDPKAVLPEPQYEFVTKMFASWVNRAPGHPAVRQNGHTWNYGELSSSANTLARSLLAQGLRSGDVVAVLGPRSFGLITSMMAVLSGGGVLLPIDQNLPVMRQRLMLQEAKAKYVLYVGGKRLQDEWLQEPPHPSITYVEPDSGQALQLETSPEPEVLNLPNLSPDDPAYIFFTSGTTGVPNAVLGCHKGLSHFINWQRGTFSVGPGDRCAQLTHLSFDPVLRDVFLPLAGGATLCLPAEEDDILEPDRILCWLEREEISLLHTTPALAQSWLIGLSQEVSLRALRWVFFAGEPLTETLLSGWRAAFSETCGIVNLYGPTETTMIKCFYVVPSDILPGVQPYGWPLPDSQALILSEQGQPCGIGEPGEVVLRTPFRTLGYLNAPEENRRRFVKNHFRDDARDLLYYTGDGGRYRVDGSIEGFGRLDDQVKIRGMRLEPEEVTAILSQHPAVATSFVVAVNKQEDQQAEKSLVAYLVANQKQPAPTINKLRNFLSERLPDYMIPSAFVTLDALPLTPTGKVDRKALPIPEWDRPELEEIYVAPRTQVEEMLAGIWAEVLKIERVGLDDNFFDLGGHSLLATQVTSRIRDSFQVEIPLRSLFETPTVAGLAAVIEEVKNNGAIVQLPVILPLSRQSHRVSMSPPGTLEAHEVSD